MPRPPYLIVWHMNNVHLTIVARPQIGFVLGQTTKAARLTPDGFGILHGRAPRLKLRDIVTNRSYAVSAFRLLFSAAMTQRACQVATGLAVGTAVLLTMTHAGPGRINFNQVIGLDLDDDIANSVISRFVNFDPFRGKGLDGSSSHARTDDAINAVADQLVHGMAGAVTVTGVPVLYNGDFLGHTIVQGEVRGGTEVLTHPVLETGISFGWNARQHD